MWNIVAVILVLAIVAIGLLEVYQSYESGTTAQSGQDLITETSSTIANLQTVYGQSPNFTTFKPSTPYEVGAVPSDWSGGKSGTYSLADGGTVTFAPLTQIVNGSTPANPNGYTMTFTGLSDGQCAALADYNTPQMYSVTAGTGTEANPAFTGKVNTQWPPALAGDCAQAGQNTVVYNIIG
jgi:hypothetical protein